MKIRDIYTADGVSLADLDINSPVWRVACEHTAMMPAIHEARTWLIRCDADGSVLVDMGSNYVRPSDVFATKRAAKFKLAETLEAMATSARADATATAEGGGQ